MSFKTFMNKVRYWDNLTAKWLMRHFYFMFFQLVLVVIFTFWFANLLHVIDGNMHTEGYSRTERILQTQSVNSSMIVFLLLLNSFWMLYIFNSMQRSIVLLKDVSFNIAKLRLNTNRPRPPRNKDQKYS